jgi:hypothetical protein
MPGFGDLEALDAYLDGQLSLAAGELALGHTVKLFELFRDQIAGTAGLKHEQTNGLLTPDAIADQARREAVGRQAAFHDQMARSQMPEMTVNGRAPATPGQPSSGQASPGCMRGVHRFGSLRGPLGEAECLDCQTVFRNPPEPQ